MVAEKQDAGRIVHLGVFADKVFEEDGRHGRDIFMTEAEVGARKSGITRLHKRHARLVLLIEHVAGKNLLRDISWGACRS